VTRLTVVRSGMPAPNPAPGETVLTYDQFRAELRTGGLMKRLFRAGESRLLVHRVSSAGRPLATALALHAVSRGSVAIEDADGRRREISLGVLGRWIAELALEPLQASVVSAHVMGGCPLGPDPKRAVTDPSGRHHHLENLYVFDGSLFPTSVGANPQLSIYGITAKLATELAARLTPRRLG